MVKHENKIINAKYMIQWSREHIEIIFDLKLSIVFIENSCNLR
jgi:hypothetical protein